MAVEQRGKKYYVFVSNNTGILSLRLYDVTFDIRDDFSSSFVSFCVGLFVVVVVFFASFQITKISTNQFFSVVD